MSGVTSSKRQWTSLRVRALTATILALALLIPLVGTAFAQNELPAQWGPFPGDNKICIDGTVINFDETTIGEGWQVTATPANGGAALATTVDEDGLFSFDQEDGLDVGTWTIAITLPAGWEPVPPYTTSFDVTLGYGAKECTDVRFKVRFPVDVWVYKIDDNHIPLDGWTIRAAPAYGNWFASPVEVKTDATGLAAFRLTHGKWVFTEKAPKGTTYTPVMPSSGKQEVFVDSKADNPKITLRFKNRITTKGCIEVTKVDAPPENDTLGSFGLPGWKITVLRPNGSVAASGVTDAMGEIKFSNLPYGPYIVQEEKRTGWEANGPTSIEVLLSPPAAGQDVVCEEVAFINKQVPPGFAIEGRKVDYFMHVGLPGWKITVTPVYKGGYPNKDVDGFDKIEVYTDGEGKYRVDLPNDDYRIPNAAYKVCEEERAGWLPHTALCQTVYMPSKPGPAVKAWDFVNQQVGHIESVYYGKPQSSSGSGCSTTHTVQAGESLYGIGAAYGVSASSMLAANTWVYSRPNYYVYPGDVVCIP